MSNREKNKREIERFGAIVEKLNKLASGDYGVTAGWYAGRNYEDGTPIARVAYWQEFGTRKKAKPGQKDEGRDELIPPRPFMRPAMKANRAKWGRMLAKGLMKEIKSGNMDFLQVFNLLGDDMRREIVHAIEAVHQPPLAPFTIAKRREKWAKSGRKDAIKNASILEKPLIDTGTMIGEVTSKAYDNGGKE